MTHDEAKALDEAAKKCESFQTKTKIFEQGWKAHIEYIDRHIPMLKLLKNMAAERDMQMILTAAQDVCVAPSNNQLYMARERLKAVISYFEKD